LCPSPWRPFGTCGRARGGGHGGHQYREHHHRIARADLTFGPTAGVGASRSNSSFAAGLSAALTNATVMATK